VKRRRLYKPGSDGIIDAKARAPRGLFFIGKNMEPATKWIRDNGTILVESTSYFVDELANLLVDENGSYLLDSQSSDGINPATLWGDTL
jgi:hypothetical protein